jgi:hypothetical protein
MVFESMFLVFALNKLFLSFLFIALQRRKVSHKHAAKSWRGALQAKGQKKGSRRKRYSLQDVAMILMYST